MGNTNKTGANDGIQHIGNTGDGTMKFIKPTGEELKTFKEINKDVVEKFQGFTNEMAENIKDIFNEDAKPKMGGEGRVFVDLPADMASDYQGEDNTPPTMHGSSVTSVATAKENNAPIVIESSDGLGGVGINDKPIKSYQISE